MVCYNASRRKETRRTSISTLYVYQTSNLKPTIVAVAARGFRSSIVVLNDLEQRLFPTVLLSYRIKTNMSIYYVIFSTERLLLPNEMKVVVPPQIAEREPVSKSSAHFPSLPLGPVLYQLNVHGYPEQPGDQAMRIRTTGEILSKVDVRIYAPGHNVSPSA